MTAIEEGLAGIRDLDTMFREMEFAPHLLMVLAQRRQGKVEVIFHPEVPVDAFENRKQLALHCERVVRTSLPLSG